MAYKIAGSVKYPFGVISPSDPSGHGLGFNTHEAAQQFADQMNVLLEKFDNCEFWNKDHWKIKPEPWVVFKSGE